MENSVSQAIEFEIESRLAHVRSERDLLRKQLRDSLADKDSREHDLQRVVTELERERIFRDKQDSYLHTYCSEDYSSSLELQKVRESLYVTQRFLAEARRDAINAWTENASLQLEVDHLKSLLKEQQESFSPERLELLINHRLAEERAVFNQKLTQAYQHIERETRRAELFRSQLEADTTHPPTSSLAGGDPLTQALIKLKHLDAQIARL